MNLTLRNQRRNNAIYTDGKHSYKIFNEGYSKELVFLEAHINSILEELGVPATSIQSVSKIEGKWAFTAAITNGKNIFELLNEDPDNTDKYLDILVDVQTHIHSFSCVDLPIQKEKLSRYIDISGLDSELIFDLKDMLASSPKHKKLCHGNFTPHNVVIRDDGSYEVVDWNHAVQGNASADVARTYLWFKGRMPDLAETYLEKFCAKTNTSSNYVHTWVPIVAAARLAKNIPEEQEMLRSVISIMEY